MIGVHDSELKRDMAICHALPTHETGLCLPSMVAGERGATIIILYSTFLRGVSRTFIRWDRSCGQIKQT